MNGPIVGSIVDGMLSSVGWDGCMPVGIAC